MDYDKMIAILRAGGVDTDTFDSRSAKSLRDLHAEISSKEVVLQLYKGRACRVALTVKILIVINRLEYIRQIKRVYPNGKSVHRGGIASISETRIRGEHLTDTVKRGMEEECGIVIDDSQIRMPTINDHLYMSDNFQISEMIQKVDEHDSSVYEGVLSVSSVDLFEVHLTERPWKDEIRIIDDNGVKIYLGYWSPSNPSQFLALIDALS